MAGLTFDTAQPSQVKGLNGWTVDPIFTVGDKIGTYVPIGILDGIGAFSLNDTTVRLYVNHEVGNTAGYKYTLANGTQLPGSRVSFFDVDKRTFQITNSGLAFDKIINRKGEVVDAASDLDYAGLNRFCSGALFEANQFGAGIGLVDRIYMAGEEAQDGTQFALDTSTNTLYAVPWFGRAAWENITEINTGRTDKVAFIIGDDTNSAPLYLYVGNKQGNSFLDRNGLANGKLFVWVADDPANPSDPIELDASTFKGNNSSTNGKFVEIAYYDPTKANTTGYDAQGFATQAKQYELAAAVSAFKFSRPEDVATNPKDGTQVALASTGVSSLPDVHGTTYRIDVDFVDFTTNNFTAKIDILVDGNVDGATGLGLRSPDNLDWADDGKIYINEDRANSRALFEGSATPPQEASIFRIDPANSNPSSTLTRIAQVDRTALPATQTDPSPTDTGNWETSGILDVSTLFGAKPGELLVFDVQAHSLRNGSIITATNLDGNGDGTKTREENLVEGGQLAFLIAPNAQLVQNSSVVGGSVGNDALDGGLTPGFDGVNDIVFTGAGNDTVDNGLAGALAGGNRIDTGSGDDTIYAANNDVVFGGSGRDRFEARDVSGYRLSGGAGNDTFYLGSTGRALGGDGDDKFFVGEGGGNLISGGAGADQFWIFNAGNPLSANTIIDFQSGTDVIGLAGAGAGVNFGSLTITGNLIALNGTTLATLTGFTGTLTAADFVFA
ncbi:MAG: DUF839 domain-containing protein [Pseudanabaenaceae cyanobacterium bins.39]|nr:DUF839 domain-containing protein [Pseudanabaenaceae cyanobacterium bins.39]